MRSPSSIIYDTTRHDNELQSATMWEQFAKEHVLSPGTTSLVTIMIKATITHQLPSEVLDEDVLNDVKTFLDFDLQVLSWDWKDYEQYSTAIRQEYIHYSEEDYRKGRSAVLEGFLKRPRLYFTNVYHNLWERGARENLMKEVQMLQSRPS